MEQRTRLVAPRNEAGRSDMNPERWQQVRSVFHQAVELAPEQRSSFLDQACSTDHSLRREVESLLSSDQEARSGFLASELTRVTLLAGARLGEYEVQSLLGSGGMGVVYRARDERLGREVAIKVLPPFFASDRERLRRFEQEARAAAALNHPNILAVYQLGTYEDSPYLVSELLEGETLRARIKRGPIPLQEVLDYARQIVSGLAAAHEKGVVHRDLKPENLFLTRDGQVKILDFGLAKQKHPEPATETRSAMPATAVGVVMGTVGYMSPEQVRGQAADFRSDIFAFGAILYEMFSGRRAFIGESSADVASAILKEDPPGLSKTIVGVPHSLDGIVRRCMEKNPEQRFPSAIELSAALRAIEVVPSRGISVSRIWPGWRWRVVTGAIIVVVMAVAVVASVLYFRSREPTIDSIAVMPFASKGMDVGTELADGLTSGLIESLSQIPQLRVMSRSSVSTYKGKEVDARKVGRELNVGAVLNGTMTPHGDRFVLDAELVNTSDDSHIWGQQYDIGPAEILAVQAEVARTLSDKLRPRLRQETKAKLTKPGTSNPEAYSFYVKGLYAFDGFDPQHMKEALDYFQQAINKDHAYAQPYGGLGNAYATLAHLRAIPFREGIQKAKAAGHRALELDPNLAEGHCALGLASHIAWEWEEAEQESRRCVELNPSLFWAHESYALILADEGKMAQAVAEQKIATELDPVSYMANNFLANVYYFSRNYDQSIEQRLKVIDLEPDRHGQHDALADCYARKGEYDKAALEYEKELTIEGKATEAEAARRAYAREGFRGLLKAQIQLWSDPRNVDEYDPYDTAGNYSLLGDRDNAFLWLDRAYADNEKMGGSNGGLVVIQIDPAFDNIGSDPRFKAFLRRMGFPQ
jgi:serine/threonine protein kinase/tetratricopeptide (TPR) repeat protein